MSKNINPIDQVTQIDQETDASISRGQALIRQFVAYDYEHEVGKKVAIAKKNIASQSVASSSGEQSSNVDVVDCDKVYVQDSSVSVGSIIKTEAYNFRSQYHSLSTHKKAIVSLGLNSIIDLSFAFPGSQSILMKSQQWSELRKKFKPKAYDVADYMYIKEVLQPVVKIYQGKHTVHVNWLNMYKKIKALESQYDPELNPSNKDVSFCLYLLLQVLLIIKHQPNIFNDQIDNSEWDFVVKFWGLITERLFYFTHLRLKWGDTHLTMHDTVSDTNFKVDLRIINDKIIQRYNTENDIAVAEVAEEDSGDAKFVSDRYKISIENKVIIDRYLLDGVKIISVDALQISGLQVFFLNTSLKEPGLYVSTELCDYSITKSLSNFARYVDLAIQLLCFRDACVSNSNLYDNHSSQKQDEKRSGKRSADSMQYDELTTMQEWIRGTWNPPRSNKTPPPEAPKNLWKS